jgi:uncharacterized protein
MGDDTLAGLIRAHDLQPLLPEGGWFSRTYAGEEDATGRPAWSAILVLLAEDNFSAMHRLPFPELWHYYQGDVLEMLLLRPDGESRTVLLGPDPAAGHHVQFLVPSGWWQGARLVPGGHWTLAGTTMTPGFHPADYEGGDADALAAAYPDAAQQIRARCRTDAAVSMGGTGANPTAEH